MAPNQILVSDELNMELTGQSIPHCKSEFQDRPSETLMVLLQRPVVHFMFKR